jgi:hypothetical protein
MNGMPYTLDDFAAEIRAALTADPGPGGREAVRELLQRVLKDADFVAAHVPPDLEAERNVIYEDPDAASRTTTARPGRSTARPPARPR